MFISAKVWKNDPFFDWNSSNICRQCILKEKKNSIAKQTETNCDQTIYEINIFWWYSKKSVTSVDKCDDEKWKKLAHLWSETTETFVDNVF